MDEAAAREFAREWYAAWNARDLERILSHYADDVVFTSPKVVQRMGDPSGTVRGKAALRAYFARGIEASPEMAFEPVATLAGVASVTLLYRREGGGLGAEFMALGADGRVVAGHAHYARE